jgi:Predicted nucleic acid-binding protein, consists of a PIN domain and a Zn-ribbon module
MICLIDTSVLIHDLKLECEKIYLTSKVAMEARSLKSKLRLEYILSKAIIYEPSKNAIKVANEKSKRFFKKNLSEADIELIAAAIELSEIYKENFIVYTDDYSIQNILSNLNIRFKSIATLGIKNKIIWKNFCKHCNRFSESDDLCEICGKELVKMPIRVNKLT